MITKKEIIQEFREKYPQYQPLFLSQTGSRLFGYHTDKSDYDFTGIFLAPLSEILLNKVPKILTFSADISFYSLSYWFNKLKLGESNAITLACAINTVIEPDPNHNFDIADTKIVEDFLIKFKKNLFNIIPAKKLSKYVGFSQAMLYRYQEKQTRYIILTHLIDYLRKLNPDILVRNTVKELNKIILKHGSEEFIIKNNKFDIIFMNKSFNINNFSVRDLLQKFESFAGKYGKRVLNNLKNEIDFKAMLHAYRVGYDAVQLSSGNLVSYPYPPDILDILKVVRSGDFDIEGLSDMIKVNLQKIKAIEATTDKYYLEIINNYNDKFLLKSLYSFYFPSF